MKSRVYLNSAFLLRAAIGFSRHLTYILTSVSMALEAEGYGTVTYADGHSALHSFQSNLPDLAILDVKMPHMDGLETLRRLRETSNLPVIFLTSKAEEIDELFGL